LSADNTFKVVVKIKVTEPLLVLSPFQGAVPTNDNACFLGIDNMNIVANIRSNLTGFYRTTTSTTHTVTLGEDGGNAFSSPQILLNLLTLQPEQYSRINTRNVLPISKLTSGFTRRCFSDDGHTQDVGPKLMCTCLVA
jgi:hypothetical protein